MQQRHLKSLVVLCLVLLMTLSAASLAFAKVTLTFWNGFTSSDGDILREIVDRFNQLHVGEIEIQMDIIPWEVMFQRLPPAIATNTAPSFILMGYDTLGEYVRENAIQPLDDIWETTGLKKDDFVPSVLDMLVVDGKQYGIPMQYNLVYLFWNKTLFAEAGLDPDVPPETWEEAMEFAVKLTDPRKNQYGFGLPTKTAPLYWLSLFWGYGGEVFDTQTLEARINSPENIAALKVVQDAVVNHRVSPRNTTGPELDNMFWAERVAMLVNGPWVINGLREAGIDFGVAAAPRGPVRHQVSMDTVGFYVPASTSEEEKQAVYKFIEYWNSPEIGKEWTMRNGFPPYLYSVINDPEVQNDAVQSAIAGLGDLGRVWGEGYAYSGLIASDVMWPLMEEVLTGAYTPEEGVQRAEKAMNEILNTYQ